MEKSGPKEHTHPRNGLGIIEIGSVANRDLMRHLRCHRSAIRASPSRKGLDVRPDGCHICPDLGGSSKGIYDGCGLLNAHRGDRRPALMTLIRGSPGSRREVHQQRASGSMRPRESTDISS